MMNKKSFSAIVAEAFADAITNYAAAEWTPERKAVMTTAMLVANRLREDNPHFDKTKFLDACGVVGDKW
jgi:hypothetical protein